MNTIRDAFQEDHRRLDRLFEALLNRVHVDDAAAVRETWALLEQGLMTHMEAEERDMIPLCARHDPVEAATTLAEHAKVRSLLAELGVMLDLHALREEKVKELIGFLRAHASREDAALYRWADRELPAVPRVSVLERLRHVAS